MFYWTELIQCSEDGDGQTSSEHAYAARQLPKLTLAPSRSNATGPAMTSWSLRLSGPNPSSASASSSAAQAQPSQSAADEETDRESLPPSSKPFTFKKSFKTSCASLLQPSSLSAAVKDRRLKKDHVVKPVRAAVEPEADDSLSVTSADLPS